MEERFQIFEPRFNNDELEDEFHSFFNRYNLNALFTNEHRAGSITVTYVDAKSVVNPGGSYHETLKDFADLLTIANDNKSYEEALFKIIYKARTFQGLMRNVKKVIAHALTIEPHRLSNFWNIVFYTKNVF